MIKESFLPWINRVEIEILEIYSIFLKISSNTHPTYNPLPTSFKVVNPLTTIKAFAFLLDAK